MRVKEGRQGKELIGGLLSHKYVQETYQLGKEK